VGFGYNSRTRHFCFCYGGDDIPVDPQPWLAFLQHPVIARHVPRRLYPRLYGVSTSTDEPESMPMFLLDRDMRKAYISRFDQVLWLLMLAQPDNLQRVFIDGLLMSPGSEEYKVPARPETLRKLRQFLDDSLRLSSSPAISSSADNGHDRTAMS
jgi:hypothetical protein